MPMIQEWSKRSLALVAQNAELNFLKVSIFTIGPPHVKYSAWLAVRLLTGNSFLQPRMKMFTTDVEILMQINLIRCAGGQIKPPHSGIFLFHKISQDKSPLVKPWLLFSSARGSANFNATLPIRQLSYSGYFSAVIVATFSTYPGNSQTDLFFCNHGLSSPLSSAESSSSNR